MSDCATCGGCHRVCVGDTFITMPCPDCKIPKETPMSDEMETLTKETVAKLWLETIHNGPDTIGHHDRIETLLRKQLKAAYRIGRSAGKEELLHHSNH